MLNTATLATRFGSNTFVTRSDSPLSEEQMRRVAPSIFAEGKHFSRSDRYTYIPTIDILRGLRGEGFQPFMVAQSRSRAEGRSAYTKHMVRMRHADHMRADTEANEIILINSHDGASSYQMLAGVFRYACCNGLVVGTMQNDVRVPHKGDVQADVIDGAFRVLEEFEAVDAARDSMKRLSLKPEEEKAFTTAALALRYGVERVAAGQTPIQAEQLNEARRQEDNLGSLWTTFNRVQENMMKGGLPGRSVHGRRTRTRQIASIDHNISLNRALWVLADEMRKLKGE